MRIFSRLAAALCTKNSATRWSTPLLPTLSPACYNTNLNFKRTHHGTVSGHRQCERSRTSGAHLPIAGVTTNPSIVVRVKNPSGMCYHACKRLSAGRYSVRPDHERDAQGMVEEARRLSNAVPGIVVKIPVTSEGLAAIKLLKKEGIPTLGTAVYSAAQGLLAATGWREICGTLRQPCRRSGRRRYSHRARTAKPAGTTCPGKQSAGSQLQNPSPGARLPAGRLRSDHASPGVAQQMLDTLR